MAMFKCKMCGGDLEIAEGASVAECQYCGSKQTLPRFDSERKLNLYDRANHFRRNNEFDKAEGIYENILNEDPTDAEAYWSLVLCRYGIEYVEDPGTRKRVPTVNRVQYASILADEDYKNALQYADSVQRGVYEDEANAIADIQKSILEISKQEEPFDVFICYKETDANGRRTPDSVLANDLYHQLSNEGFKVFFSRITLEDKIGSAYEPYIFAALNSARVMVVLGTKPEYFSAVWVKNEWSRYLALIRAGADKVLVPAYRDMDPYDLPEEFAHLQAQDMGKLGFMQDLIRGIKKITAKREEKPQPATQQQIASSGVTIESLMKRAKIFMEDGDFSSANEYLDKVLDIDPEYAPAYVGKVQASYGLRTEEILGRLLIPYENNSDWQKALRFATPSQKSKYNEYAVSSLRCQIEQKKAEAYGEALSILGKAKEESDYWRAIKIFESLEGYRDSFEQAERARQALNRYNVEKTRQAEKKRKQLEAQRAKEKKKRKIVLRVKLVSIFIIVAGLSFIILTTQIIIPNRHYNNAIMLRNHGQWQAAIAEFQQIIGYRDSAVQIKATYYSEGEVLRNYQDWDNAIRAFEQAGDYSDAATQIQETNYLHANSLLQAGMYEDAYTIYTLINGYKDVDSIIINNEKIVAARKQRIASFKQIGNNVLFGSYPQTSQGMDNTPIEWIVLSVQGNNGVLLVSRYALDCQRYHGGSIFELTWQKSTLRTWLNTTFFYKAFNTKQQAAIQNRGGDHVFLLSYNEASVYFSTQDARKCVPTDYAIKQGVRTSSINKVGEKGTCLWWLRLSDDWSDDFYVFDADGKRATMSLLNNPTHAVRPAIWLNLDSDFF